MKIIVFVSPSWPIGPSEELRTQTPRERKGSWFSNAFGGRPVAGITREARSCPVVLRRHLRRGKTGDESRGELSLLSSDLHPLQI